MVSQGVRVQKFIDACGLSRYLSSPAKLVSKAPSGGFRGSDSGQEWAGSHSRHGDAQRISGGFCGAGE